jgi:hypothetical protein
MDVHELTESERLAIAEICMLCDRSELYFFFIESGFTGSQTVAALGVLKEGFAA